MKELNKLHFFLICYILLNCLIARKSMRDEKDMRKDNLNEDELYKKGKYSFQEIKFE